MYYGDGGRTVQTAAEQDERFATVNDTTAVVSAAREPPGGPN